MAEKISLYNIAEDIRSSLAVLFSGEEVEGWEKKFDGLELALEKKGLAIRHVLREIAVSEEALASEIKRLQDRKHILSSADKRLKAYTIEQMDTAGRDEIKVDGIGLKIVKTPPKTTIVDLDVLAKFHPDMVEIVQEVKPIDKAIKAFAKDKGESPAGTEVSGGRRLRVD